MAPLSSRFSASPRTSSRPRPSFRLSFIDTRSLIEYTICHAVASLCDLALMSRGNGDARRCRGRRLVIRHCVGSRSLAAKWGGSAPCAARRAFRGGDTNSAVHRKRAPPSRRARVRGCRGDVSVEDSLGSCTAAYQSPDDRGTKASPPFVRTQRQPNRPPTHAPASVQQQRVATSPLQAKAEPHVTHKIHPGAGPNVCPKRNVVPAIPQAGCDRQRRIKKACIFSNGHMAPSVGGEKDATWFNCWSCEYVVNTSWRSS